MMDSTLNYLLKRDGDERDGKEPDFCGPVHRSGDCNYINCSYSVDHYHCQICGSGAIEASQALYHIRTSPTCRRDTQGSHLSYLNEPTSSPSSTSSLHANANALNAFYGSLTSQNSLCSSSALSGSFSGYSQLDSFQWHPTVPVDKMAICGPQLSPCLSASNSNRIPIDPSICSPISDLYSKATAPVKDLVSLPAKSSGTPSESQSWYYNNQSMQLYKYVEQTSVPQLNFLLLDPPTDHKDPLSTDLIPYSYSNKSDWNLNHRDKESYLPFCSQQSLQPVSSEDSASLFALQIQDDNLNSKQADLFSNEAMSASSECAQQCSTKTHRQDASCSMLIAQPSATHNSDMSTFAAFPSANISDGNISDEEHSSSGSESDIIVEDTTDQLTGVGQSQVSIESIRCSLLEEVENVQHENSESFPSLAINIAKSSVPVPVGGNVQCGICHDISPGSSLIHLGNQLPITSTSHSPVLLKLSQLVNLSEDEVVKTVGDLLCQRCLSLVDAVDSLESQLESARQNILIMLKVAVKTGGILHESDVGLPTHPHPEKQLQKEVVAQEPEVAKVNASLITIEDDLVESFSRDDSAPVENVEAFEEEQKPEETHTAPATGTEDEEKGDIVCAQCGSAFTSEQQLNQHSALHKQWDTKFLCEICGRRLQYRHQHQIELHLAQHFPMSRFSCQHCDKSFKSKRALKEHGKVHTGARPFSCPNCDRRFAHSSNMRAHFKLCSGDLPYRCDKCKAGFSAVSRLDRHVALAHSAAAAFKCSQCNRTFGKLSDFRSHERVHSNLRIFSCPVCDRSYKSLSNLNQHAKSHRKEKPYSCQVCGQGFLRKDSWECHMLSHKKERPFKCTETSCPKAFWSKENLAQHLKRHAGTHKKTKCPVCEKTFSQKLSVHMRTHTGDRPYRCNKCDKAFVTGSTLNKHVLRKHSNPQIFA